MANKLRWVGLVVIGLLVVGLTACTASPPPPPEILPDAVTPTEWTRVDLPGWENQPGFSISLPPGWRVNERQGIDSYVGEVVGDGVRLHFDYGAYSWNLDPADDPAREYEQSDEEIGGVEAKVVMPKEGQGGFTGVYFQDLDSVQLNLVGEDLTGEQQRTAMAIFRSVRSLGR